MALILSGAAALFGLIAAVFPLLGFRRAGRGRYSPPPPDPLCS